LLYPLPAFAKLSTLPVARVSGDSGDAEIGEDRINSLKLLVLGCASAGLAGMLKAHQNCRCWCKGIL